VKRTQIKQYSVGSRALRPAQWGYRWRQNTTTEGLPDTGTGFTPRNNGRINTTAMSRGQCKHDAHCCRRATPRTGNRSSRKRVKSGRLCTAYAYLLATVGEVRRSFQRERIIVFISSTVRTGDGDTSEDGGVSGSVAAVATSVEAVSAREASSP